MQNYPKCVNQPDLFDLNSLYESYQPNEIYLGLCKIRSLIEGFAVDCANQLRIITDLIRCFEDMVKAEGIEPLNDLIKFFGGIAEIVQGIRELCWTIIKNADTSNLENVKSGYLLLYELEYFFLK